MFKGLRFSKSKILLNFTTLDFHRLDPLFAKLIDPPPFLVILLICKFYNFPGSPDPAPTPTPSQIRAWRELFYVWLETMSHRSFVQCIYKISMRNTNACVQYLSLQSRHWSYRSYTHFVFQILHLDIACFTIKCSSLTNICYRSFDREYDQGPVRILCNVSAQKCNEIDKELLNKY